MNRHPGQGDQTLERECWVPRWLWKAREETAPAGYVLDIRTAWQPPPGAVHALGLYQETSITQASLLHASVLPQSSSSLAPVGCQSRLPCGRPTLQKQRFPFPISQNASRRVGLRGSPRHCMMLANAHSGQGAGVEHVVLGPFPGTARIRGACLPLRSEPHRYLLAKTMALRLTTEQDAVTLCPPPFPAVTPNTPTTLSSLWEFMLCLQQYKQHGTN